jgi:hypothetical protein
VEFPAHYILTSSQKEAPPETGLLLDNAQNCLAPHHNAQNCLAPHLRTSHVAERVAHTAALAQAWAAFALDHDLVAMAVIGSCACADRSTNASSYSSADRPTDRKSNARAHRRAGRCATNRVGICACQVRHHNKSRKGRGNHQCFPHLCVSFVSL